MSKCVRGGSQYRRHKYKEGVCVHCKASQAQQLRELATRRAKRKALKAAAKK